MSKWTSIKRWIARQGTIGTIEVTKTNYPEAMQALGMWVKQECEKRNKGYTHHTRTKTCETCAWRDADRYCTSEKITDYDWKELRSDEDRADMLIYGQFEEGGFRAGDNFGCVHHKEKEVLK